MKPSAIEAMRAEPKFYHRIHLGLDIDNPSNLEYFDFFEHFFRWYLAHVDRGAMRVRRLFVG
jgi:hypothetical protein